jgi:hypothetical protein
MAPSSPPNKSRTDVGRKKKQAIEFTTQQRQKFKYQKDYQDYKPALERN